MHAYSQRGAVLAFFSIFPHEYISPFQGEKKQWLRSKHSAIDYWIFDCRKFVVVFYIYIFFRAKSINEKGKKKKENIGERLDGE